MRKTIFFVACVGLACSDGSDGSAGYETGAPPTGGSEASGDGDGDDEGGGDGDSSGGVLLDVGDGDDTGSGEGGEDCACGEGGLEFSYIWISNTSQGTVSKIDTQTMVEEGRYITRPDGDGSPSRTSVTVSGRAAAVANRYGGVTKIHARPEDCVESNGTPGIQTSSGFDDVLSWGEEECVAWYTPFPEFTTQRPVAWTAGELNPNTCTYGNEKLWTSGCGGGGYPGFGGQGGIDVHLLDGATGAREESVHIEEETCYPVGAYGAAVDGEGDLWFNRVGEGAGKLGWVSRQGLDYELYDLPDGVYAYGMTVDAQGRPWVSNTLSGGSVVARFDPETLTWAVANDPGYESSGGMQQDQDGRIWVGLGGANHGVAAYDSETLARVAWFPMDGGIKGVSVDVDGHVWAVSHSAASRLNPESQVVDHYAKLVDPYTYSDMTGFALFHTACPEPEG